MSGTDSPQLPRRVEEPTEQSPGRFHCTECGDCCRMHRVPLTASDLARLRRSTELPPFALVDWLSPEEVDMTGEPESFVILRGGRRLPVLSHVSGACRFLDPQNRCGVYGVRPTSCRTFPLELGELANGDGVRHLEVLPDSRCPGTFDGPDDTEGARTRLERRKRELERHASLVVEWNRRQRRHRWSTGRMDGAEAFLTFALRHVEAEKIT